MLSFKVFVRRLHSSQKKIRVRNTKPALKPSEQHQAKQLHRYPNKTKKHSDFYSGAHSIDPRFFKSIKSYLDFFEKYIDFAKYTTAMFTVTTISHKTSDSRHPLVMLTNREGYRYLFGKIPEGSQRILNENRFRLGKLKSIFLSGTISSWSEIGGLPGLFLTISDSTKKSIDIFTNSGKITSFIVATWRYFVFRKGVELKINDSNEHDIIADSNLIVKPIKIESNKTTCINEDVSNRLHQQLKKLISLMFPMDTTKVNDPDPTSYKSDPSETEIQTHVKLPNPFNLLPTYQQPSLNYLVRFLPIRGKFDPIKAKSLGIKPGIDFRKLTQGHSIVNEQGETVHPHQVIEESKLFLKLLIVDIPNASYLSNTLNCEEWFRSNENIGEEDIGIVYHFLGDDIDFNQPEYLDFIKKFPDNCKHVISHSKLSDDTLIFKTSAINVLKLKCLQKDHFNLPYIESYNPLQSDSADSIHKLQQLQQFHIETSSIKSDDSLISEDTWSSLYDSNILPLDIKNINKTDILESEPISLAQIPGSMKDQVQVVTLGTGSALPSIHRNVISTLVRIPYIDNNTVKFRTIMLDGGENTLGTMMRNFGHNNKEQLIKIFEELSLIHLSHLHADHHLGIISIINKWFEINIDSEKKLYLVIPWQYNNFMKEWYSLEEQIYDKIDLNRIVYLSCEDFIKDRQPQFQQVDIDEFERKYDNDEFNQVIPREKLAPKNHVLINDLYKNLGINSIQTVRAIHCYWSYSISIDFALPSEESFKVSYSGDTRPNPKFVDIGYGSDLLIHESSLDHELIEEAISKKHSTMIEAITVSKLMNCAKVILTHFSTRYSNKANMLIENNELIKLSTNLRDYLVRYGSTSNIFVPERSNKRPIKEFEDLQICFAFDMMNVRFNNLHLQKDKYKEILEIFQTDDDLNEDLNDKREKEMKKQREKREAKRIQRLSIKNGKKKRRVSSDEEID